MFEVKTILLVSAIIFSNSRPSFGAKYECERNWHWCEIHGLNLTSDDFHIEPVIERPGTIKIIKLFGTAPIFSASGICEALPKLKIIRAELSMEAIAENAFEGCSNVNNFIVPNNNLIKLEGSKFKGLTNLHMLTLTSNHLFDLNVEDLLHYMPNLTEIGLADNNLKCSRVKELLDLLKTKNIEADMQILEPRTRDYTPEEVDGIQCLSDSQWETEFAKLSIEQQAVVKNVAVKAD